MGKASIKTNIGEGQYTVEVGYNSVNATAEIATLKDKIATIESNISDLESISFPTLAETNSLNTQLLQLTSLEKKLSSIEGMSDVVEEITVWCADYTKDLTGDVGTIEVPGEKVTVQIQPGYDEKASYEITRDGQLFKTGLIDASAAFYNLAMLPGWQKWKPTFRHGIISNIGDDTCTVTLEALTSSQQNLVINQEPILTDVPIEYMFCDGSAFENGDSVLVQFTDQDFASPKVIGFKDNPKDCFVNYFIIEHGTYLCLFAYDSIAKKIDVPRVYYPLEPGETQRVQVVFPVLIDDFDFWFEDKTTIYSNNCFQVITAEASDENGIGPSSNLECPTLPTFPDRYTPGAIPIGGCNNSGADCIYWYCSSTPDAWTRTYNTANWFDENGDPITEATQQGWVEHHSWYQDNSQGNNDYGRKWDIEHSEKLDYYSYKGWQNLMNLGASRVGVITSKDMFVVWDHEVLNDPQYMPDWMEHDHTDKISVENTIIYDNYAKKFPMGIPPVEYNVESCYVANNYQDPRYYEDDPPREDYSFEGKFSRDLAVSILAMRVETTRHYETEPVTHEDREVLPKTLASINIHWQDSDWSHNFDPWSMTANTLVKNSVQEMFDLVGGELLDTTLIFYELVEE